jgi:hypothetical protein
MENGTAAATPNPTADASASTTEASATLLASASNGTDGKQQTQTTETPAVTTEKPAAAATTTETKPATEGAPEKYEFKAPEGTEYDSEILDAFTGAAKEANLSQDAAQKLIGKMAPALAARQADQIKVIQDEWRTASAADAEFGGEKLKENLAIAKKALDTFGTPELSRLLDESGLGNNPEVIRYFYRAGKAISEDKFVGGTGRSTGPANPASVLYNNTPQPQK